MTGYPTRTYRFPSVHAIALASTALLLGTFGCEHESTSPTSADRTPLLASVVASGLQFRQISAGHTHTCGVTLGNTAYCWGFNWAGQVGNGTTDDRFLPAAVVGGHRFSEVTVGLDHSCGVTLEKKIYCWGRNSEGELGDGTFHNRPVPVLVAGGRAYRSVD